MIILSISYMFFCMLENFGVFTVASSNITPTYVAIILLAGSIAFVAYRLMLTFTFTTSFLSFDGG